MSDEPTTPQAPAINLTAREQEIAIAVLLNQTDGIKIDYAGMAAALGLKSNASAVSSWAALRKKLYPDGQASPNLKSATKTKASPKPKASETNGVKKQRTPKKPAAAKAKATTPDDTTTAAAADETIEQTPESAGNSAGAETPGTPSTATETATTPTTATKKARSPKKPAANKGKGKTATKAAATVTTTPVDDNTAATEATAAEGNAEADTEMADDGAEETVEKS